MLCRLLGCDLDDGGMRELVVGRCRRCGGSEREARTPAWFWPAVIVLTLVAGGGLVGIGYALLEAWGGRP